MFANDGLPRVGVFSDTTDRSMPILELAKAIEERGFVALYLNEHTHQPVEAPRSLFPIGAGSIPDRYSRFYDPYIALSFVAAQTSLEVGPMVSLVGEHDAIALAKAIATLDVLSEGRFVLGVGFGWHREEFEDHGQPANVRAHVVRETVELMNEVWTKEVAEYRGTYRRLSPSWSYPKPAQRPRPPVLLGAPASERNFARVAAWADGWVPMFAPVLDDVFPRWIGEVRAQWDKAARDPSTLQLLTLLTMVAVRDLPAAIDRLTSLGVQRCAVRLGEGDRDQSLRQLDRLAAAVALRYR